MQHLPFLLPLLVLVLSECTKALVEYARSGHWHKGFFRPGGMPSTHSAFVTSVMITVAHARGVDSIEFLLAFSLACVVCMPPGRKNPLCQCPERAYSTRALVHSESTRTRSGKRKGR